MTFTTKALTKEGKERIAKEMNELLKEEKFIVKAEEIRKFVMGCDTAYIAFCEECNIIYQPESNEPIRKVLI